MISKSLTYHDYDGVEHTKEFYFSMNQTEFALLNNRLPGGFELYLKKIQEDKDQTKLLELLTMFIVEGYGERLPDGLGFSKEDLQGRKLGKLFVCTEACDNLITDLLEKENNIGAFLTGMLPASIQGKVEKGIKEAMAEAEKEASAKVVSLPSGDK